MSVQGSLKEVKDFATDGPVILFMPASAASQNKNYIESESTTQRAANESMKQMQTMSDQDESGSMKQVHSMSEPAIKSRQDHEELKPMKRSGASPTETAESINNSPATADDKSFETKLTNDLQEPASKEDLYKIQVSE